MADKSESSEPKWAPPSEDEFNHHWLTPEDADELMAGAYSDPFTRKKWIMDRLKGGLITAVARDMEIEAGHVQFAPVNSYFFNACPEYGRDHFWETGDESFKLRQLDYPLRCFDIRFDPETFTGKAPKVRPPVVGLPVETKSASNVLPELVSQPAPLTPIPDQPNKGGRPRHDYWEPLLIEMFDQLWHGQLTPKTQADIEGAMHNWLSANGHGPSERAVRQRAQSLWKVWIKEGNN